MTRQKSKNTQPDQTHPMTLLPKRTTSPEMDNRKGNRVNRFANKFAYPTAAVGGGKKEKEVEVASVEGDATPVAKQEEDGRIEHLRVSGGVREEEDAAAAGN